jgi:hypothetical protein
LWCGSVALNDDNFTLKLQVRDTSVFVDVLDRFKRDSGRACCIGSNCLSYSCCTRSLHSQPGVERRRLPSSFEYVAVANIMCVCCCVFAVLQDDKKPEAEEQPKDG